MGGSADDDQIGMREFCDFVSEKPPPIHSSRTRSQRRKVARGVLPTSPPQAPASPRSASKSALSASDELAAAQKLIVMQQEIVKRAVDLPSLIGTQREAVEISASRLMQELQELAERMEEALPARGD